MSLSQIMYDPPSQQQANVRTVYKIQKGVNVLPQSIKLVNLKINPTAVINGVSTAVDCFFAAMGGSYLSIKQVELLVGDKPVDLFLSKQMINFKNSLGSPDLQLDMNAPLTSSNNNVYQEVNLDKQALTYLTVDEIAQSIDFKKMLDYLNNRMLINEGLTIIITWDSSNLDWLCTGNNADSVQPEAVNIDPGYISYEVITGDVQMPSQKVVNFKQTIEEAILIPSISVDDTIQYWEQRMNSLRDKFISRVLFVNQPLGTNADIGDEQATFGKYASYGMNNEYMNIVIDGAQKLSFKGFSNAAHKLAMTNDTYGPQSSSMTSFYNAELPVLIDGGNQTMKNYNSYLGVELNTFVNKECVIQYNRQSSVNDAYPSLGAQLKLFMISEVVKQHNLETGVCTYLKV